MSLLWAKSADLTARKFVNLAWMASYTQNSHNLNTWVFVSLPSFWKVEDFLPFLRKCSCLLLNDILSNDEIWDYTKRIIVDFGRVFRSLPSNSKVGNLFSLSGSILIWYLFLFERNKCLLFHCTESVVYCMIVCGKGQRTEKEGNKKNEHGLQWSWTHSLFLSSCYF